MEGPEAGVYYRGTDQITNNESTIIQLPEYLCKFARDFTIQVTSIYNGISTNILEVGEIVNNQFKVYGKNGKFHWLVQGKRHDIIVEPNKKDVVLKGDGPYKWL